MSYQNLHELQIADEIYDLIENEIAPETEIDTDDLWKGFSSLVHDLSPKNKALLEKRAALQASISQWHIERKGKAIDPNDYKSFLESIGYLLPEPEEFEVGTQNVDAEIADIPGPQLVVPVDNARYALNACNARWGSLLDALYGTDVIPETEGLEKGSSMNPKRAQAVFNRTYEILDQRFPIDGISFSEVANISIKQDGDSKCPEFTTASGESHSLVNPTQFVGYTESEGKLSSIFLIKNNLHVEIAIDRNHPTGQANPAGIKDVMIESAITTIQDFEDSVAAVDAEDKSVVYGNWNGLMKGTLEAVFDKGGRKISRRMNPDRSFIDPAGNEKSLPGRSLLLARNVGLRMSTDAVLDRDGNEIPEHFLDGLVTALAAIHDLKGNSSLQNSRKGSIYIVKPKMHGPEEVAFVVKLFDRIEKILGLAPSTMKIGIMDEERRTTVNLKRCIFEAKDRIVFINTGFLDRTGDEIHTSMEAGPVIPKMEIKNAKWMIAYEDWNVDTGIETRLPGKGQIGKGMWAMPDDMRNMLETKIAHPMAGANTAWVPSPTAASLHALHYHEVDVFERQKALSSRAKANLDDLLEPPLLGNRDVSEKAKISEVENNAQGILGYVSRWVEQGVGCSKVPDINNVGLMEDRATLRISSQHLANWLHHGLIEKDFVTETFKRIAVLVDNQNAGDPSYRNMSPDFDDSIAFQAALDLVFNGVTEINGYTEPALHKRRREAKRRNTSIH